MPKNFKPRIKILVLSSVSNKLSSNNLPSEIKYVESIFMEGEKGYFLFSLNLEIALLAVKSLFGFRVLANSACIYLRDEG